MNDKANKTDTTILLDIYQRLGTIETKLENIKEQNHEPRIVKLEQFEGRVGMYLWLGGGLASGILFILWEGLKYLFEYGIGQWFHR